MKFSLKIVLSLLLVTLTSGCSSMDAHGYGGYGKPFSGTALSVVRLPCFFRGTAVDYAFKPFIVNGSTNKFSYRCCFSTL
ncbi:hypothetical protein FORC37_p072 (plasmid) [Vibrio vulnificus]|nr:hypothetical protein FORC37_p072 [Vibrio vulnificus]